MNRISKVKFLCMTIIGCLVFASTLRGQTLELLRASYSNDVSRIESNKLEVMKVAVSEYSRGLDKVRAEYVKKENLNFKGAKAVDEIKNEIFNGNIKLDTTFPEILIVVKKYQDAEAAADKVVKTSKKGVLEKYLVELTNLCAEYLKSDMAKAEKVNYEKEMVDSLLKEYVSVKDIPVSGADKKQEKKSDEIELIGMSKNIVGYWRRTSFPNWYFNFFKDGSLDCERIKGKNPVKGRWKSDGKKISVNLKDGSVLEYSFDTSKSFSGKNPRIVRETWIKEQ